jgi:AcrR family transcriptional regulator
MFYFMRDATTTQGRRRRPARAAHWTMAVPLQARSRDTVRRFAAAAEALLRDRPFERITIQDIVARAERPIGSFYARFKSKAALLPFLYERYDHTLAQHLESRLGAVAWAELDFSGTVEALVGVLVGIYEERRWLLRALALFARQHPEALSEELVQRRRELYAGVARLLLRHRRRIAHPDPEAAVRFGIFMVTSVAREQLVFSEAPQARVTALPTTRVRGELSHALHAYLSQAPTPA